MPRVVAVVENGVRKIVVVDPRLRGLPGTGTGSDPVDLPHGYYDTRLPLESVAANSFHALEWKHDADDALLDLTTPTAPTLITGGLVAVRALITTPPVSDKNCLYELDLDEDGADPFDEQNLRIDDPSGLSPGGVTRALHVTAYCPAGGVFKAYVKHNNAGAADFRLQAWIQYIAVDS